MDGLIIIVEFSDKINRKTIQVPAPKEWGNTAEEVAKHLTKELNNEDTSYMSIGGNIFKKIYVESASVLDNNDCN